MPAGLVHTSDKASVLWVAPMARWLGAKSGRHAVVAVFPAALAPQTHVRAHMPVGCDGLVPALSFGEQVTLTRLA